MLISLFLVLSIVQLTQAQSPCEWGTAEKVLMHTPGSEIRLGTYHPKAALFAGVFDPVEARQEHHEYMDLLKKEGANVLTITEILLQGTIDANGNMLEGEDLDELRQFSLKSLTYSYDNSFGTKETEEQEQYRRQTIMKLSPKELVEIIFNRPTIQLSTIGINTKLVATYITSPVMNMYFLRDQLITTSKGIVLSRMNSAQRFAEVDIVKFVLSKMKITPLYEVKGDGRLEGGDFIPAGDIAFIGQGLRTNAEGIKQLIENDVFGDISYLVVVKDPLQDQDQMHLDTYFNIISPRKAVLIETRMHGPDELPVIKTVVDLYKYDSIGKKYSIEQSDLDFVDYLRKTGFTLIPVSNEDQLNYGINFLTIYADRILAIDGVSNEYKQRLKQHKVNATWMDFSALTSGYGAAHCTTQVLRRNCKENWNSDL
jgi:arginine deiminase